MSSQSIKELAQLATQQRAMHDMMIHAAENEQTRLKILKDTQERDARRQELLALIQRKLLTRTLPNRAVIRIQRHLDQSTYQELCADNDLMQELTLEIECLKCQTGVKFFPHPNHYILLGTERICQVCADKYCESCGKEKTRIWCSKCNECDPYTNGMSD